MAKISDPLRTIDVGVIPVRVRRSEKTFVTPLTRYGSERNEVVVAFNLIQLCQQRQIRTKARQCFQKTRELLRGRIDDAVVAFGIVKTIVESSVRIGS